MTRIPVTSLGRLLAEYEGLLLDAYGVLITHNGAMPGSRSLIGHLNRHAVPHLILTNDASRSPKASSRRYREMGLDIPPERVITSGSLLGSYLEENQLRGQRCLVLGTVDSVDYVEKAGGIVVPASPDAEAGCLIVCDERGYPLRESLDTVLSFLYGRIDRGEPLRLVLPNPDLVYPAEPGRFGFTAGAVAYLLEEALARRYPHRQDLRFERLGKPHSRIYREALRRIGVERVVFIGDQLDTDIRGAVQCGIDSALILTGVTTRDALNENTRYLPTYLLPSLDLDPGELAR